jgi:hypothetical protein
MQLEKSYLFYHERRLLFSTAKRSPFLILAMKRVMVMYGKPIISIADRVKLIGSRLLQINGGEFQVLLFCREDNGREDFITRLCSGYHPDNPHSYVPDFISEYANYTVQVEMEIADIIRMLKG